MKQKLNSFNKKNSLQKQRINRKKKEKEVKWLYEKYLGDFGFDSCLTTL